MQPRRESSPRPRSPASREYLDSKAAAEQVPDAERLRVSGLGTPQARAAARGPRTVFALGATFFVFIAGCGALLAGLALVRGWRVAAAVEQETDEYEEQIAAFDAMLADPALDRRRRERAPRDDAVRPRPSARTTTDR